MLSEDPVWKTALKTNALAWRLYGFYLKLGYILDVCKLLEHKPVLFKNTYVENVKERTSWLTPKKRVLNESTDADLKGLPPKSWKTRAGTCKE